VIVSAARTPIGSFGGELASLAAADLGAIAIKAALQRATVEGRDVGDVTMGCVLQAGQGQAPARQAAIRAGLPTAVPCQTINKVCGSGLKAVITAAQGIALGDTEIAVAGGMESMSNVPYYLLGARNGYRMGHQQATDGNGDGGNGLLFCGNVGANGNSNQAWQRPGGDVDCEGVAGSASIMHVPTGLFLTGAAGQQIDHNRNAMYVATGRAPGNVKGTDTFWYVQAGIEQNWFGIGKTTLYGEYHSVSAGSNIASSTTSNPLVAVSAGDVINGRGVAATIGGAEVRTWGVGIVQAIDAAAMDLYISYRVREADVTLRRDTNGALYNSRPLEDLSILSVGGMIKF